MSLVEEISRVLYKYDLGQLRELGAPSDEYIHEANKLVANYHEGFIKNQSDVSALLKEFLSSFYGKKEAVETIELNAPATEVWRCLEHGGGPIDQ